VSAVLPLKESSRELIIEVARALQPHYAKITRAWRHQLVAEFAFDERQLAVLDRLNISTGCAYFCKGDFSSFFEHLNYFSTRLAKLEVDTRAVARSLDIYSALSEPHLGAIFGERQAEAMAALEMLSSATFVAVSGAYFDTKTRENAALVSVLEAELSADDVDALLGRVLNIVTGTFGATLGSVVLREADTDQLRVAASIGFDHGMGDEYQFRMGHGFAGHVAQTGEPDIVLEPDQDPRIVNRQLRSAARSLWGVPMKAEGKIVGVIVIGFDKQYEWLPTERSLMRAIADRSALAIARARVNDALREREARIVELSAHLLQVQEAERKRISRELHDETGQALMVIRLYLGMLEQSTTSRTARSKIRETLLVVDRTIEGLRRMIARLSPLVLQELGLIAAIRKEAKDLAKNTGVKARVAVSDNVGRLAPECEAAIYRVVQEALHNVAKHAQAKAVNIQMGRETGLIRLVIEDDGQGMAKVSGFTGRRSFGLAGMRERISMLGGTVKVSSIKGKGTRIEVVVPVEQCALDAAQPAQARGSSAMSAIAGDGRLESA
jgi:signal transduction histidine kinase